MSAIEWEIRLRTNFTDRDKDTVAKQNAFKAARHLYILMGLLQDDIKPEIIVTGKDWFTDQEVFTIEQIIKELGPAEDEPQEPEEDIQGLSPELLEALSQNGMKGGDE